MLRLRRRSLRCTPGRGMYTRGWASATARRRERWRVEGGGFSRDCASCSFGCCPAEWVHDVGAQVGDPRDPLWASHTEAHVRWWVSVWRAQRQAGCARTLL